MHEYAYAKVNLYLHVTGRRPDGYHQLDSLAVFPEAADRIEVAAAPSLGLSLAGRFAAPLEVDNAENLVLRAARALQRYRVPSAGAGAAAALMLDKQLPIASGIGGGSADAAATLRLLCRFWAGAEMPIPEATLLEIASGLGADVPVCLGSRPTRMQGVGEILLPAPSLPDLGMVLLNCGEAVATPAVFRARAASGVGFTPPADLPRGWDDVASLSTSLAALSNDLEAPARALCPRIDAALEALRALPGCRFARMSGSGATCFALFDSAADAARALPEGSWPAGWWSWAGGLHRAAGREAG